MSVTGSPTVTLVMSMTHHVPEQGCASSTFRRRARDRWQAGRMATLRERITAPAHLELPVPIAGLTFRAATRDDLAAVHALAVAAAAVDDPHARPSTASLERTFSTEGLDLARDTLVGVDAEGHVQAYGIVIDVPSRVTAARVVLEGAVHPALRGRGIGRRVLAWLIGRAR